MERNPSERGWESVTGLPIDEKIIRIRNADVPDLIKGMSEVMHDRSVATMKSNAEIYVGLPLVNRGDGETLNEIIGSQFKNGKLEVSYRRSLQDGERREIESEEIVVSHFVWGRVEPEWKRRKGPKDDFEEFTPTEEEQATFRTKCLEAVVRRYERLEQLKKTGSKTIETLGVKGNLL